MVELSVVVPVYNEEKAAVDFLEELKEALRKIKVSHEVIVVDDASSDRTYERMKKVKGIKLIRHPYNKGYGASLKTGTRHSRGEYVLFIDGDGEHDPKNIKKLMEHRKDFDMVVGARKFHSSFPRMVAKRILTSFANYLSGVKIVDLNSGLRLVKRKILAEYLDSLPNRFSLTSTLTMIFVKSGYSIKYVPVNVRKRKGKSKINPLKDFLNFLILLMKTSLIFSPLRVFLPVSFFFFITGMVYLVYNVLLYSDIPDSAIFLLTTSVIVFFFGFISDQISSLKLSKGGA